jgi:hypothetical protein
VGDPTLPVHPGTDPLIIDVMIRPMDAGRIGRLAEALANQYAVDCDEVMLVFHPVATVIDGMRLVLGRAKYVRTDSGRAPLRHPLETIKTLDGVITVVSVWDA